MHLYQLVLLSTEGGTAPLESSLCINIKSSPHQRQAWTPNFSRSTALDPNFPKAQLIGV